MNTFTSRAESRHIEQPGRVPYLGDAVGSPSAVSWGAILAGAAGAAALALILFILGTGLGLSSLSPWSNHGASATTIGVATIVWLIFTHLAASGMGGYLAGRLRTKWVAVHADEVYFRDTAHGFLAWAVATLVTAALLTSAVTAIVSGGAQAAAAVAGSTATVGAAATVAAGNTDTSAPGAGGMGMGYFVDTLFRPDMTTTGSVAPEDTDGAASTSRSSAEVARIFANDIRTDSLPPEDMRYVAYLVAQRTGIAQADAEKRVSDAFGKIQAKLKDAEASAREAADKARKTSAYTALWLFVSLLGGAFVASLSATYGGRRRDL